MTGAFLTALCFAGNAACARRAAIHYGAATGNFLRLLLAAAILGAWAHGAGPGFGGGALDWFLVSGAVGFGLGGLAMFHALPLIGSNLSMLIVQCGSAVAAALVEWAWLGTRISAAQTGLAALTLAGVALGLANASKAPREAAAAAPSFRALGIALAVLSACAQGGAAVTSRKAFAVARVHGSLVDPASSAYQRVLGGLAVAILAFAIVRLFPRWDRPAPEDGPAPARTPPWIWVILNTLLGPVIGVTCYQWALRSTPAGIVLPIVATAPLLTVPVARILEGSRTNARYWAGAVLAVLGAALLAIARQRGW